MWTRTWRARVTAAPGRPRSSAASSSDGGPRAARSAAGRRTARGRRGAAPARRCRPGRWVASRARHAVRPRGRAAGASRAASWASLRLRTIRPRSTRLIWLVLLGDHDDERVGLLGDAEGRPVAGPEALGVDRRLGERQQRAGREDRVAADDDGAVVERRPGREDRAQEVGRQVAVDHDAGLGDLLEPGLALDDDERAVAVGRQAGGAPAPPRRRRARRSASRPARAASANEPTRPIRSRARRSSGWKTTTRANRPTTAPLCRIWVSRMKLNATARQ